MSSGSTVQIQNIRSPGADGLNKSLDELKAGAVEAIIVFGPNFTTDIRAWIDAAKNGSSILPSTLALYSDSSNPIASAAVQAEVQRCVQTVMVSTYKTSSPVRTVNTSIYGDGTDMRDFMAPAIAGLLIFILTLMATMNGGDSVGPRYSKGEMIAAQCLSALLIGCILATTIILTLLAFGLSIKGDVTSMFALLSLLALASAALGVLLNSVIGKHKGVMAVIFPLILYPAILLGGIILPLSSIPDYLLPISYLFPLTYAIEGVRLTMLNGFGWESGWVQAMALVIYTGICMVIAWLAGRRSAGDPI